MNQRIAPAANEIQPATAHGQTVRLTAAQALVRYLVAQRVACEDGSGRTEPLFGGVFAIFGHGNVAGLGEALYHWRHELPTLRAHNEQAMAHSAIAFAKAHLRRRMMAVTTSIGPGATNLVTAAALAHAPVVQDQNLRGTSSWANTWLGRDHLAKRTPPALTHS